MKTLFEYLYRDAGNFKAFGCVALKGALNEEEQEELRACFDGDGVFIAEQIGVPALYGELYRWSGGHPTASDHCWHEFLGTRIVADDDMPAHAAEGGAAWLFLARLKSLGAWREDLSPHFDLASL